MKKKDIIIDVLSGILRFMYVMIILWIGVSLMDIVLHNLASPKEMAEWNLVKIFLDLIK